MECGHTLIGTFSVPKNWKYALENWKKRDVWVTEVTKQNVWKIT